MKSTTVPNSHQLRPLNKMKKTNFATPEGENVTGEVFHMHSPSFPSKGDSYRIHSPSQNSHPRNSSSLIRGSDLGLLKQKSTSPTSQRNPFLGTSKGVDGVWNKFKTVILFPIALLRLFLCVLFVAMIAGACKLILITAKSDPERIGKNTKRFFLYPVIAIGCRIILFIIGFYWIPVRGKCDRKARIMISNHTTMVDVFILLFQVKCSFLSKSSVLKVPLIGIVCQVLQVIGVDRASHEDKEKIKLKMKNHISNSNTPPLLVFPEGTTSRYDTILRFKPGAFENGVSIQPILLHYRWNFFDPSSCATTDMKIWALQILSQVYHYVEVEYLPCLIPDQEEKSNPLFFASNARKVMHQKLNRRAMKRTCYTPGFVHEVEAVQQGVDDFLVWRRLMGAKLTDLQLTLHSFSLESVREAIDLASPTIYVRKRIDLSFILAACERYARIWNNSPMPGHEKRSYLSYSLLTECILGDCIGSVSKSTFISAFSEAAVFTCLESDAFDFRQFATALIWLSNCTGIWGEPFQVFKQAPRDAGVLKWASVRARIAFSLLCSQQVMKDEVGREDIIQILGEAFVIYWDRLFVNTVTNFRNNNEDEEERRNRKFPISYFRDTIVQALSLSLPEDRMIITQEEDEVRTTGDKDDDIYQVAAYRLIEACFNRINNSFRSKYFENGSLFLTDEEIGFIHSKQLPKERQNSIGDSVVEEPSQALEDEEEGDGTTGEANVTGNKNTEDKGKKTEGEEKV